MMSVNVELERDMYNWHFQACACWLWDTISPRWCPVFLVQGHHFEQKVSSIVVLNLGCTWELPAGDFESQEGEVKKQVPPYPSAHIQQVFEDTMTRCSELLYIFPSSWCFLLVFLLSHSNCPELLSNPSFCKQILVFLLLLKAYKFYFP